MKDTRMLGFRKRLSINGSRLTKEKSGSSQKDFFLNRKKAIDNIELK